MPAAMSQDRPEHHVDEGFRNYPLTPSAPSLGIGFYLRRAWSSFFLPEVPDDHYLASEQVTFQLNSLKHRDTITWIGQSTFLIRLNGITILTDPFFTEYAGPFSAGPRRFIEPGISANQLPPIDIIIVSHNHYDHLDETFIESLPNKNKVTVFVPLKLKSFFVERGYSRINELDWHESASIDQLRVTALPSVHYSGRGTNDKNETLWCSWSIETPTSRYFFIGDSAYSTTLFKDIGKNYGPFDLAMLTIGTYGNRKYGANNHTTPEEAIQLGLDIGARTFVGMHWGTIEMSDESPWEPPRRFLRAASDRNISSDRVWMMKIGETRVLPASPTQIQRD